MKTKFAITRDANEKYIQNRSHFFIKYKGINIVLRKLKRSRFVYVNDNNVFDVRRCI